MRIIVTCDALYYFSVLNCKGDNNFKTAHPFKFKINSNFEKFSEKSIRVASRLITETKFSATLKILNILDIQFFVLYFLCVKDKAVKQKVIREYLSLLNLKATLAKHSLNLYSYLRRQVYSN